MPPTLALPSRPRWTSLGGKEVDDIVESRAREGGAREGNRNFLSVILSSREAGDAAASRELFTADYVSALTYEHLLARSATTSFTLSSVLYLMAGHPEVERKLLAEVAPLRRPAGGGPFRPEHVGTWIWLALGVLAKDPRHFSKPHLFKPRRFDPDGEEEKCRHHYAHIPFGIIPSPLALDYDIILNFKHGVKLQVVCRAAAAPCSSPGELGGAEMSSSNRAPQRDGKAPASPVPPSPPAPPLRQSTFSADY
ncbi:hypothetical protein Taro_022151 [Colocasia esculenta]|uniref:Cytochrome P450 n=1 Tax=Colocasia esculenta TaxID=4460 RepID=A0A843V7J6_COLES|nr:hypothetical protein [Colocasia esculenta]